MNSHRSREVRAGGRRAASNDRGLDRLTSSAEVTSSQISTGWVTDPGPGRFATAVAPAGELIPGSGFAYGRRSAPTPRSSISRDPPVRSAPLAGAKDLPWLLDELADRVTGVSEP